HLLDLEWLYQTTSSEPDHSQYEINSDNLTLPPIETLQHLQHLALMGDVCEIRDQLSQLDQTKTEYHSFVMTAQSLVEQFQLIELQTFLSKQLS
ncbi:MAG: hypothetical protein F6K11_36960, partial [Leptolyngbya sp. SIO3F4]|nr:hypothetical protein [Leptolyngbya sp. SIO3F4]